MTLSDLEGLSMSSQNLLDPIIVLVQFNLEWSNLAR